MPAELILQEQISFMLRRAEPDDLDTAFSSRNYICASKISPGGIKPMTTVNPHAKYNLPKKLVKQLLCLNKKKIV